MWEGDGHHDTGGVNGKLKDHAHRRPRRGPKVALSISGKVVSLRAQLGLMFDL